MFRFAIQLLTRNNSRIAGLLLALLLSGCAGSQVKTGPIFFPPAPNPPRIQYLMGISDSSDIEGKKSSFSLILTGRESTELTRRISKPYGITSHKGKIYVCDIGVGNVIIIDPALKTFEYLKGNVNIGKLKKPANTTVDKDGNLYVADVARKEIVVFTPAGDFLRAIGKEVDMKPSDVLVDEDSLYVLDIQKKNNEIKVFDLRSGALKGSFGKAVEGGEGLAIPTNFTMDDKGFIYTTNAGTGRIIKLDKDGHILFAFGEFGDIVGKFSRPKGVAVDHEGRIYVVDSGSQNVQIFTDKGRIIAFFGDPGLVKGSLNLPASITVTKDNLEYFQTFAAPGFILEAAILVTNQYGEDKISVYGLGQMQGKEGGSATGKQPVPDGKKSEGDKPEPAKDGK